MCIRDRTYLVAYENGKAWEEAKGDVLKAKEATEQAISAPSLMMGESLMDASAGYDTVLYLSLIHICTGKIRNGTRRLWRNLCLGGSGIRWRSDI